MNIIFYTLRLLALKAKTFESSTKDPAGSQNKVLQQIILRNRNTEYGRKYGFAGIKSLDEYRGSVPIVDYESLRPYVERMAKGENNILTADKPVFFSITSGSTALPKLVPVTDHSRRRKADVTSLWAYYIARDYPKIPEGKTLVIVSPEIVDYTVSGVPYGAESGHAYKNQPAAVKSLYSIPYEVFEIEDYDARYYTILRIAMGHNITNIATMTPSTIILLCQKIEKMRGDIIKDIQSGTLRKDLDIPPYIRTKLERRLRPDPKRADELERIVKEKKELLPKYFWPDLQLIECWKSGAMEVYLKALPQYFGDVPVRDFGYFSSEMRSSVPMNNKGAGGVLAVTANFYEFIPREDIVKKEQRVLLCGQLERGKEYYIILTTPGGLYRYNIDDVIRVDGFFNNTPVIEFVQKGTNVTSATGEKLYESQVAAAVKKAADRCGVALDCFVASVEHVNSTRYAFLVEFTNNPDHDKKKKFLAAIEEELCRVNEEYMFNRAAQELDRPVLKVLRAGSFEAFKEKKIKEGAPDSQFKLPQLTSSPDFQKNFDIFEEISMD